MEKRNLVLKFLSNKCTAAEAEEAMRFIAENPGILDELAPQSEWDEEHTTPLPQHIEAVIRKQVIAATGKGKLAVIWKPLAVAASVIAIVISAFLLIQLTPKEKGMLVTHEPVKAPTFDTVINERNKEQDVSLADGSRIVLYAKSSVIYSTGFKNKREIYLTGKAVFHVAKNPNAPFVVYSGPITTTALGTIFLVDARTIKTNINVQLYEGKVVVKSVNAQLPVGDTYLQPGEQCHIDLALALVKVSDILKVAPVHNNREAIAAKVEVNKAEQPSLNFEKVPLAATFERLQSIYGKKIVFDGDDNAQDLFTGQFDKNDSLLQVLQIIAGMNGLHVAQEGNGFKLIQKAAVAYTAPVKANQQTDTVASPVLFAVPSALSTAKSLAVIDSSHIEAVPKDANGMQIVELPTGRDYRKVPLSMVFDQIAKSNNIHIKYHQEELKELYFTGTIPNDQSSVNMLPVICRMNGLKLMKKKGSEYNVKLAKQ